MNKLLKRAAVFLLAGSTLVHAAEMDITATFSPSMSNPENNAFTNTTPNGGYCSVWPHYCTDKFSIALPFEIRSVSDVISSENPDPKDHVYFKFPGRRRVVVTNMQNNTTAVVEFSFTYFSARSYGLPSPGSGWVNGHLSSPSGGCTSGGEPLGSNTWYHFIWKITDPVNPAACYKVRSGADINIASGVMRQTSIGYTLDTPSPLNLASGIYTGSTTYTIGPGMDFELGNKWSSPFSTMTINFILSVNHELQLTTTPEERQITLQPCAPGKVCTEEEGKANWERWMVNRIAPQMTGRSNFTLSSSGAFTVFLQCGQQIGQDCALQSENSTQQVPVQALLTLPENIVDKSTGATVSRRALRAGKDTTHNIFNTRTFGQDRKGSIDFVIAQKDVQKMVKTRPNTYKGTVTVIFDPLIY